MKYQKLDDFLGKKLKFIMVEENDITGTLIFVDKGGIGVHSKIVYQDDEGVSRERDANSFLLREKIIYWTDDVE